MIHECLVAVWVIVVVTWFVWERWLSAGVEQDVRVDDADGQLPAVSRQQVTLSTCTVSLKSLLYRAGSGYPNGYPVLGNSRGGFPLAFLVVYDQRL